MQEKMDGHLTVKRRTIFLLAAIFTLGLSRCTTDVDLTAPYVSIPVVFGLLDAEADTQWVRINRTWLGDGDQTQIALIPDSSEYETSRLSARFVEVVNDIDTRVFELRDTLLQNKDEDGVFFAPEHKAYYAPTRANESLNPDALYRLDIVIDDSVNVSAETNMIAVSVGNIQQPPAGLNNVKLNFANVGPSQVTYPNYPFKWVSTPGASRYDAVLLVHFIEHYWADDFHTVLDSTRDRTIEMPIGTVDPYGDAGYQELEKLFDGQVFFNTLKTRLDKNIRITRELGVWDEEDQIARAFDFLLIVANETLAIYLDVNAPVTGIIQERPEYSNVNGGLGLWASRTTQGVFGLGYTTDTIEHLQEGDDTAELNFCTPNPFSDYTCQ
ncbi:MAG: hypothetical protein OSA04_03995 [Flavobacteriales bacterium]|nr:hypothetical protein [Flavobacteriales bacterium]